MAGVAYVIFDGDNDKWAYAFMNGWKANKNIDFDYQDAHDLDNMTGRAQDEQYVKSKLRERMKNSSAVIVLVGEKTKNLYKYVRWELELALELDFPIIVANLNKTNRKDNVRCPAIIRDACAVHIPYTWKRSNTQWRTGRLNFVASVGPTRRVATVIMPTSIRSRWLKSKNPLSEAVRREREEDWNGPR